MMLLHDMFNLRWAPELNFSVNAFASNTHECHPEKSRPDSLRKVVRRSCIFNARVWVACDHVEAVLLGDRFVTRIVTSQKLRSVGTNPLKPPKFCATHHRRIRDSMSTVHRQGSRTREPLSSYFSMSSSTICSRFLSRPMRC
jgi:hypothetical protein